MMKKMMALLMTLMLTAGLAAAAPADNNIFETLEGIEWSFSSGVGAWSTDLSIKADGTFAGEYHDSEMGDSGDGYPDGSVYLCPFHGQMSLVEQTGEKSWKLRVDSLEKDPVEEKIEENVRYVPSEAYGLAEGDELLLYAPGTPISDIPEEMLFWTHALEAEDTAVELTDWFLMDEKSGSGFVGWTAAGLANPWVEMTAEELREASGLSFGVPEEAEQVIYLYLPAEGLAEMQFLLHGDEFCARIQAAAEPMDISGMYFQWEDEEAVQIGACEGTVGQVKTGSTEWVQLCRWYDAGQGLQYALSVYSTDPDGLDLAAVAQQVYQASAETP